jgi:acyl-CoA thioesterase FadM
VADITGVGCDLVYRCTNKNTGIVIAIVKTGIVFYDYLNKKITTIPLVFKEKFNAVDGKSD